MDRSDRKAMSNNYFNALIAAILLFLIAAVVHDKY